MFENLKGRRARLGVATIAVITLALTGCSTEEPAETDGGDEISAPFTWAYGTGAAGGTSYNIGAAQAEGIRALGGHVTVIAEETAGGASNITRVVNGELQLGFIQSSEIYGALNGTGNFEETGPLEGLQLVFAGTEGGVGFIASEASGIETYADLCGKKVGVTSPGGKTNLDALLTSAGVDTECIEWNIGASYDQMVTAISDGTLDAGGFIGIPTAAGTATLQLAETTDIVFLSADPADKAEHDELFPYWPLSTVPAGSFPNQENDWLIAGFFQNLYTHESVSEQQVYDVIMALIESHDACIALQAGCATFNLETTADRLTTGISIAPPHAGLIRVLEETGTEYSWNG